MKKSNLALLLLLSLILFKCSSETEKENYFSFNSKRNTIHQATYQPTAFEDGNFLINFFTTNNTKIVTLSLSNEWLGKELNLAEIDNEFDWSYFLNYDDEDVNKFRISGSSENKNISGTIRIDEINKDKKIYHIKIKSTINNSPFNLEYRSSLVPDETEIKATLIYDGVKQQFPDDWCDTYDLGEGNYNLRFWDGDEAYLMIQLSASWNDRILDLTKLDNVYSWFFHLEYNIESLSIWGNKPVDVSKWKEESNIYVRQINKENSLYEIRLDGEFDGKKIRFLFVGQLSTV